MSLEKVYDYFHNYDKQTYQVVARMGNEPSEQDIKDFENQYGINLPADFREFTMSPLGGLYMEVREEIWPQAKQYDIGPSPRTQRSDISHCSPVIGFILIRQLPSIISLTSGGSGTHSS